MIRTPAMACRGFVVLRPVPERGRLYAQRPQVHIALPAVMNLVINKVHDVPQDREVVLPKQVEHLAKALLSYLRLVLVDDFGVFVPLREVLGFSSKCWVMVRRSGVVLGNGL